MKTFTLNNKATSILKWLLLSFTIVFSFGCKTDLSKIKPPEDIKNLPQLSITNFKASYKMGSSLKAQASAPIMNKYTLQKSYTEFPKGVEVKFYDDNYVVSTSLNCKYAINYTLQELWKFSDTVIINSVEGGTLKTQELYFDQKNEKIYSVKFVEVTDPTGTVIRGKGGFESNYDFTIYEFKNVDGLITFFQDEIE
ncbi:MAG: LPS export ABC transporter periplasmic protein LptC [Bacteroidales bacterium]|nr:LPS export ABC transporter periplasmic protein LptC [Bacteroidales bacterium]